MKRNLWRNAKWFVPVEPRRVTKSHDFSADLYESHVHISMTRKLFLQYQDFYSKRFGRWKICGESGSILSPLFTLWVVVVVVVLYALQPRAISTERSVLPITKTCASSLKDIYIYRTNVTQLGSMFISNCTNTLHVSNVSDMGVQDRWLPHIVTIWLSAETIDLGRPYWILHPTSCHTPEAVTTVFKCSWGWMQKASERCRVLLQLLINILPSCITLVLYIY